MAPPVSARVTNSTAVPQTADLGLGSARFFYFTRCPLGSRALRGGDFGSKRRSGAHEKDYDDSETTIGLTLHSIPVGDGLLRNQQLWRLFPRPYRLVLLALPMLSELLLDCKLIPIFNRTDPINPTRGEMLLP